MVVEEPEFTEVIENVTVPAGRNVRMACSVKNLGTFKASVQTEKSFHQKTKRHRYDQIRCRSGGPMPLIMSLKIYLATHLHKYAEYSFKHWRGAVIHLHWFLLSSAMRVLVSIQRAWARSEEGDAGQWMLFIDTINSNVSMHVRRACLLELECANYFQTRQRQWTWNKHKWISHRHPHHISIMIYYCYLLALVRAPVHIYSNLYTYIGAWRASGKKRI